jgi:hypothetical protein
MSDYTYVTAWQRVERATRWACIGLGHREGIRHAQTCEECALYFNSLLGQAITFRDQEPAPKEAAKLYIMCLVCKEVFEGNEPEIAKAHESSCTTAHGAYSDYETGQYALQTEEEAL